MKTFIIAEAGVNHNGDIELAKKLILAAKDAKADCVKFQTWVTEEIVAENAPKAKYQIENDGSDSSQFEMLKRLELSFEQFKELKEFSEKVGISFLSTPDDIPSLNFLSEVLNLPLLKVGSGEITNLPFLKKIGNKQKKVILSTGMSNLGEVERAYYTLISNGAKEVALLHCTSNYPASFDSVNLTAMNTLQKAFQCQVGYSDHTVGNEVAIAAVALGATIIEKHFTLDQSMEGPDHKASINPDQLAQLVSQIRNVELAFVGGGIKRPTGNELDTKMIVTKGIYLSKNAIAGEIISEDLITMKRPVAGFPADAFDLIKGLTLSKNLPKGSPLSWKDIQFD